MSCSGEALQFIQRIKPHRHTFESLLAALAQRFTHPEEVRNARRALDNLKMSGMSARDYCNKFERLLDEAPPMSEPDILFCFHKGLPEWLQTWMNYQEPTSLHEATMLVCKMAGQRQETNSAQPSGSGREPMEIGRLSKKLDQATAALNRLTTSDPTSRFNANRPYTNPSRVPFRPYPYNPDTDPRDPRNDARWPSWAKDMDMTHITACRRSGRCYFCGTPINQHVWFECPKMNSRPTSPIQMRQPSRSPSPTWTARKISPNGQGPR